MKHILLVDDVTVNIKFAVEILKDSYEITTAKSGRKALLSLKETVPDLILLDEPTNHLDKDTKDFVINYLKNYPGGVFIISHDIEFLNKIVEKILYMDKKHHNMELFDGNYDQFKRVITEREIRLEKEALLQDKTKNAYLVGYFAKNINWGTGEGQISNHITIPAANVPAIHTNTLSG